ncbi:ABC transporter ATP-binding protein [Hymenobacter sp. DG25A]|uniref:ABC transporter ATP-binding protein n=1 Tax=Hymenobacter sp. DG25A TaxID=1385663 RepID=UPI0018D11F5C|nr:ABC transporter ATP-binding protein [Hymenobacter sp. DG25A]
MLYYLSAAQRRQGVVMFVLLVVSSLLEAVGLAALVPVIMMAAKPGAVHENRWFSLIYNYLGFITEKSFLLFLIIAIFVFFILKNIFNSWVLYAQARFTSEIGMDVVQSQIDKYLNFPLWKFQELGSAKFINGTIQATYMYVNTVLRPLFSFFSEIVIVLIIVVGILIYKPILVVILVIIMGTASWATYGILRNRTQAVGSQIHQLKPASLNILNNLFNGFLELKLANKQHYLRKQLLNNEDTLQRLNAQAYLYNLMPIKIIEMVAILGLLTILLYSVLFTGASDSLITLLGLFAAAAYRLMPSINRMLSSMVSIKQGQASIEELWAHRTMDYDASLPAVQLPLAFERDIVFKKVSYTFPGSKQPVLNNINIAIQKGDIVGFVGSSGSGKTTLMNVLLRFLREQEGHIAVDGQALTPDYMLSWYKLIGYVKQDTFLMEASIMDNITLQQGEDDVDMAQLLDAIDKASLTTFIQSLPEGVNTLIGERGSRLSGGQRQRIGIARALYKQAQILVLDEATSALDNETEREVNEAIHNLSNSQITILIVAHRLTTLRECNRILELSQGKLVGDYDYETLISTKMPS